MSNIDSTKIVSAGQNFKNGLYTTIVTLVVCVGFSLLNSDSRSYDSAKGTATFITIASLAGSCIALYFFYTAANDLMSSEIDNIDYTTELPEEDSEL